MKILLMPFLLSLVSCAPKYGVYKTGVSSDRRADCRIIKYGNPETKNKFNTNSECLKSDDYKKIDLEAKDETKVYKEKLVLKEKERIRKIDVYIRRNKKFKSMRKYAVKKSIVIGMPNELLYLSWGKAYKENKSVGSWGRSIQHIYSGHYVYTRNGVVTSW